MNGTHAALSWPGISREFRVCSCVIPYRWFQLANYHLAFIANSHSIQSQTAKGTLLWKIRHFHAKELNERSKLHRRTLTMFQGSSSSRRPKHRRPSLFGSRPIRADGHNNTPQGGARAHKTRTQHISYRPLATKEPESTAQYFSVSKPPNQLNTPLLTLFLFMFL